MDEEHKIRLGTVPKEARPRPSIQLGTPLDVQEATQPAAVPPPNSSSQQRITGFSSEKARHREAATRRAEAQAQAPKVRPSILILACAAGLILLLIVLFGPRRGSALGFDNNAALLQKYDSYRSQHLRLPGREIMAAQLNSIVILENRGDTAKVRHAWQEIVLQTQDDKQNPIYQFAVDRLKRAGL